MKKKTGIFAGVGCALLFFVALLLIAGGIGAAVYFLTSSDAKPALADEEVEQPAEAVTDDVAVAEYDESVFEAEEECEPEQVEIVRVETAGSEPSRPVQATVDAGQNSGAASSSSTSSTSVSDDATIYDVVEENAQFPGGDGACVTWLSNHVSYPAACQEQGIQGRVIVSFVVEQDGSISNVRTVRSPDPLLTAEAERVVKQMPKWKPARKDGVAVRSRFNLPVIFRLN